MLVRSTSTRRTGASRNAGTATTSSPVSRGRRASVATDKGLSGGRESIDGLAKRQRSPRGSIVPNVPLDDDDDDDDDEPAIRRFLPDPESCASHRGSLMPAVNRSPRNSLVPDDRCRSPRASSLAVPTTDTIHNPCSRNSPTPGGSAHSRNSLPPPENAASRTSTHSSSMHEGGRSPRGSMLDVRFDKSPRGSICPDTSRSPRGSIAPTDVDGILPRGSILPDPNRSPRGSVSPEPDGTPRGSIASTHVTHKSSRYSVGRAVHDGPSGGGSIVCRNDAEHSSAKNKSPRGSIGPDIDKTPRGSLGGHERRIRTALTPQQDPRRASADQGTAVHRNNSPYRQPSGASEVARSAANYGAQTNLGYGTNAWADSRRASSSVSQFSGDESRRLCGGIVDSMEKGSSGSGPLGVATYGTLVFQLKDAHREASGTCDFVFRAMRVVSKTMLVTVCLACLSILTILMLIMGLQFIRECPREPNIPLYMVVGGALGSFRMFWALYSQIRSRRLEASSVPSTRPHVSPMQLLSVALSLFLSIWFVLGNYWILSIRWPEYAPKMFDPDHWCDKTLYVFSVVHLGIAYAVLAASIVTAICLAMCRFFACPLFERYK